jgi:hypothetical protein
MGIFKSKEEKRIERDIEVRKGINAIKRNIKQLKQHEKSYLEKAKRAKRISDMEQLRFLKSVLKKTMASRRLRERQLLSIETAMQIKNQAEADAQFAQAMMAVSKAIAEVYGATDLAKTQKQFEKALVQAETMQERMRIFLDMTSEQIITGEVDVDEEIVSDEELDKLLEEEAAQEDSELDEEIKRGLREIEEELQRE